MLWSSLAVAHTSGVCLGCLSMCDTRCARLVMCLGTRLKVYFQGTPKEVCHNEVVFLKSLLNTEKKKERKKKLSIKAVCSPTQTMKV